jgi:hypothetical protein
MGWSRPAREELGALTMPTQLLPGSDDKLLACSRDE